jgi:hypothetical protein
MAATTARRVGAVLGHNWAHLPSSATTRPTRALAEVGVEVDDALVGHPTRVTLLGGVRALQ